MDDIKKFDNVLPQGYADQIEKDLLSWNFPWYYVDDVTNAHTGYGDNSGLVHLALNMSDRPSDWMPFIKPLVYTIEQLNNVPITKLLRIRVGMLPKTLEADYEYNTPHVDFLFPHYTACYYVNDSDGDTVIFDKKLTDVGSDINDQSLKLFTDTATFTKVATSSPRKNSLCVFDGFRFHASTKPR